NMNKLESFEIDAIGYKLEDFDFDLLLRRGAKLKDLNLELAAIGLPPVSKSTKNYSLTRLELCNKTVNHQVFIDSLPSACPRLQDISLIYIDGSTRFFSLSACEHLKSIKIRAFGNGNFIAKDLWEISQHFAIHRPRQPLESIILHLDTI